MNAPAPRGQIAPTQRQSHQMRPSVPRLKAARGARAKSDASIVGRISKHENPEPAGSFALCKSVADQLTADTEPLRVDRRLFRLSHAAMAGSFSMA